MFGNYEAGGAVINFHTRTGNQIRCRRLAVHHRLPRPNTYRNRGSTRQSEFAKLKGPTPLSRVSPSNDTVGMGARFEAVPLEIPDVPQPGRQAMRFVESVYGALLGSCRVRRIELPIALLDSARPLVSSNGDADMVRANPLACCGDFLLCLASRQAKDLIAETWRAAIDASRFRRCRAPAST